MTLQDKGMEQQNAETKKNKACPSTMFRLKISGTAILCYNEHGIKRNIFL